MLLEIMSTTRLMTHLRLISDRVSSTIAP